MKRKVENWSVERLHKERATILFPEYQRQPNLWSTEQMALLIDSILMDIDIPKLYFNRTSECHEVVDGQQRLWALWKFLDDEYLLKEGGNRKPFSKLAISQRETIKTYKLQIVVFDDADDEYLRELFLRLQLGKLLVTGERLHALSGQMKDFVFKDLSVHPFMTSLGIPDRRYGPRRRDCLLITGTALSGQSSRPRNRYPGPGGRA